MLFKSSDIADDTSKPTYFPNLIFFFNPSQVRKRSQVPASRISPQLRQLSQQFHKIFKQHVLGRVYIVLFQYCSFHLSL